MSTRRWRGSSTNSQTSQISTVSSHSRRPPPPKIRQSISLQRKSFEVMRTNVGIRGRRIGWGREFYFRRCAGRSTTLPSNAQFRSWIQRAPAPLRRGSSGLEHRGSPWPVSIARRTTLWCWSSWWLGWRTPEAWRRCNLPLTLLTRRRNTTWLSR